MLIRLLRPVLALVALGALLTAAVLANPLTTRQVTAEATVERSIPFTDVNPIGANFFIDREVEGWKKDLTFRQAREAGVGWGRVLFSWEGIEPRRGSFFDEGQRRPSWDKYDEIVDLAERHGIRLIARLDRTPEWARGEGTTQTAPPNDPQDYARYAAAVASRYRGRIQFFQVWNEPNLKSEWGGGPADARAYLVLLRAAAAAIRAANPDAVVLSAPMAQTLDNDSGNRTDLSFVEELYRLDWTDAFDILSANAYGFDRSPQDPANPAVLNFARVDLLREIMERNADGARAVWIAEFGWNASPASFPPANLPWQRVSEAQQAAWTVEGMAEAARRPWLGVVNLWYFRQVGDLSPSQDSAYYFRVVDTDFTPRLPFFALRDYAAELRRARVGWFEESSAAVRRGGQWRDTRAVSASGGSYVIPGKNGDTLALAVPAGSVSARFFGDGECGVYSVRVDGQPVREITNPSVGQDGERSVQLAAGLPPGPRLVELTAVQAVVNGRCGIDGFSVADERDALPPWLLALAVACGAVALLVAATLLLRRVR